MTNQSGKYIVFASSQQDQDQQYEWHMVDPKLSVTYAMFEAYQLLVARMSDLFI
jgi:hypothetical protein